jgi:hypothetical protein
MTNSFSYSRFRSAQLACLAAFAVGVTQGPAAGGEPTAPPSSYLAEVGYAWPSSIGLGSQDLGRIDTLQTRASYAFRVGSSERYEWRLGLEFQRLGFDVPAGAPLPDSLYGLAARFGNRWSFADAWSLSVQLTPGIYSDLGDVDWGDVNVPALVFVSYSLNPELQLFGGASVDARRDAPVIPALGLRWRFSPGWELALVYPNPRLEYAVSDGLRVFAGADILRSTFRVAEDFGDRLGRPELNDRDLSYADWKLGGGLHARLAPGITAVVEGGWMVDRRFHFDDRNLLANGDGAPYVRLALRGSF